MTDQAIIIQRTKVFSDIVGCAFRSYNYFHWGFDEIVYEAGLKAELEDLGYEVFRQQEFPIYYKGRPTEVNRRMDLVVRDKLLGFVVLELKALDYIYDAQRLQLWSYMKLLNVKYGMLINFSPKGVYSENWMIEDIKIGKCVRV